MSEKELDYHVYFHLQASSGVYLECSEAVANNILSVYADFVDGCQKNARPNPMIVEGLVIDLSKVSAVQKMKKPEKSNKEMEP